MMTVLFVLGALVLMAVGYRIRCAMSPFTSKGRRRGYYWARGWWAGDQAQNRGDWR